MSSSKFTLGKKERLKSRKLIEQLFREGKSFALHPFRVYYAFHAAAPAEGDKSRTRATPLQAGFGAGTRHFKKATHRNRIKRLTREAYRLQKEALQQHLEEKALTLTAFFIYTGKELPDYAAITEKIGLALQKLIKSTGS